MDSLLKLGLLTGLLSVDAVRAAEPPSVEQVSAELDRELQQMVKSPSPEVRLLFSGLDPSGYKLVEVHFTLDGKPLEVPPVEKLASPGPHVLTTLQVEDGPHTLVSNVVYMDASWNLFSQTSGLLWNVTSTLNFQTQRGLRVDVKAMSMLVPEAKDPRQKVKLSHDVTAEMIAKLEDGPPPPPEPHPEKASVPDAGVVIAPAPTQPEPTRPPGNPEPPPATPAAQPQKAKLLVRATVLRKSVAATISVRGSTTQKVTLKRGAKAPTPVEVTPGEYTVDVIAPGFLAQTRRVLLSGGNAQPLEFALVRAPKKKLVKEKNDRLELLKPLRFPQGKAAPLPGGNVLLQQLVDTLVRRPIQRIRIEGHTDNQEGEESERKQLSEERAKAVAELLVQAGVDPARIETAGLADSRPKAPNITPRGRELNRRVELVILER
ncbi:OmpA family protein [Archangium violaceum]|uniref:OmpA family protein n=1 Tax=Archangium violaceum TaxID=83451 RepID=UPI00193AE379|nr:OmpA family protein [Archangium violaceum]QRK05675.1 OmpA family protein [Archangium violaceum]